ncbi:MAG: chorismate synthase, partial [Sedimentisphaerales bacterium]|nr:chorismate synthase [Sedimentisphaerales bacterium]
MLAFCARPLYKRTRLKLPNLGPVSGESNVLGCHFGRNFQVSVAGGSYQEGLTSLIQGVPPGMLLTEQEIYGDLLLRKPGADELSS